MTAPGDFNLDQFDIDWEALNDFDHTLSLFNQDEGAAAAADAPAPAGFDFFDIIDQYELSPVANATRKHKRDSEPADCPVYGTDDEEEVAKAMRPGNFGRIIAESVVASGTSNMMADKIARPVAPMLSYEERSVKRKGVVTKWMRCLNFSDMSTLAKVIKEHCHERVMFMGPDVRNPIYGKADMMILFSLMMEAYPDGVWKIVSTDTQEDKVACKFSFRGTKVFPYPLETVLTQIKACMNKDALLAGAPALASMQLVQDIAERVHPTVAERIREEQRFPALRSRATSTSSMNSEDSSTSSGGRSRGGGGGSRTGSMSVSRPVPPVPPNRWNRLEAVVLREGLVTYFRVTDFVFDEYDQIVRVISENV